MKGYKKLLIVAAAIIVPATVGLLTVSAVQAQEDHKTVIERVAEILGIEKEDMDDAFKQAQTEKVDELLVEGKIDAEKAEELKKKIEESDRPIDMRGKGKKKGMRGEEHSEALSEFFGISEEELKASHEEGKRMPDLLEEYGKTEEELHEFMTAKFGEKAEMEHGKGKDSEGDK